MQLYELEPGDTIFAAENIKNDGSLPGFETDDVIATKGQRGVIINTGHLEDQPNRVLFLVRFETGEGENPLGPAVACWPEELSVPKEEMN